MLFFKIKYHLCAYIKIFLYKIIFREKFKIGKKSTFRNAFNIYLGKDAYIHIGNKCFFNHGCSVNSLNKVIIGNGCIFGENVKIYDHNHRFSNLNIDLKTQGYSIGETIIEDNCWIGSNVIILKGAHIGNNCVIGAGCIIDKDIPSFSLVKMKRELEIQKIESK